MIEVDPDEPPQALSPGGAGSPEPSKMVDDGYEYVDPATFADLAAPPNSGRPTPTPRSEPLTSPSPVTRTSPSPELDREALLARREALRPARCISMTPV